MWTVVAGVDCSNVWTVVGVDCVSVDCVNVDCVSVTAVEVWTLEGVDFRKCGLY